MSRPPERAPLSATTVDVANPPQIEGLFFRRFRDNSDHEHLLAITHKCLEADGVEHVQTLDNVANLYRPSATFDPRQHIVFADLSDGTGPMAFSRRRACGRLPQRIRAAADRSSKPTSSPASSVHGRCWSPGATPGRRRWSCRTWSGDAGRCTAAAARVGGPPGRAGAQAAAVEPAPGVRRGRPGVRAGDRRRLPPVVKPAVLGREPVEGGLGRRPAGWHGAQLHRARGERQYGRLRGYTEYVNVARPWRGRGVAKALLVQSLGVLEEQGMTEAALTST